MGLTKSYLNWIVQLIGPEQSLKYRRLLGELYNIYFAVRIPMDQNRAEDGVELRYRFGYENDISNTRIGCELDNRPCTILELMVALALRTEVEIMCNPDIGARTPVWFWDMVCSLGLEEMTDDNYDSYYVYGVVDRLIEHRYHPNGQGGLFTIKNPKCDIRTLEIWDQLTLYLNEKGA